MIHSVRGRCPLCRTETLFLGSGGFVTCSMADCPDPEAPSRLLQKGGRAGSFDVHEERLLAAVDLLFEPEVRLARLADDVRQLVRAASG